MSIDVGNLNYAIEKEDLNEVFNEYGNVRQVHIPTNFKLYASREVLFFKDIEIQFLWFAHPQSIIGMI